MAAADPQAIFCFSPAGEGEDAPVKQGFQPQLLRHQADPLTDSLLGQSVIFRAKGQLAGRIHIEKLGAWILEHRAYHLGNLKERQIAGIFPAQIDRACKSSLVVMGDQSVQQTGQGRLAAAGGPQRRTKEPSSIVQVICFSAPSVRHSPSTGPLAG